MKQEIENAKEKKASKKLKSDDFSVEVDKKF